MEFTQEEIRQQYDKDASWYDLHVSIIERLTGMKKLRRELLQKATGHVLEIAVGTGRTFSEYPEDCAITAIDLSTKMLEVAQKHAVELQIQPRLLPMDAHHLSFSNHSFNTVVMSLSLCTISDPFAALREMARVCQPDGKALFLQHGRSSVPWIARFQDRHADAWYRRHKGCLWNQDILRLVGEAGFEILSARRAFFGIIHAIEAKPSSSTP